uniref:Bacteriophage T5 Orf172 DNA-binding domain-containing protein n=1 Tax=viral metagenome TaxID=1070528 RepID=A0A6M3IE98_9ZZZZ
MTKINPEFKSIIPPITNEEYSLFESNQLGFEGDNQSEGCLIFVKLMPTPLSPSYWIFSISELKTGIETYSKTPISCSRIPWSMFKNIKFKAMPMLPIMKYPEIYKKISIIESQSLYIIQAINGGAVKIGISHCPEERLKYLQTGSPVPLRIIRCYKDRGLIESKLHKKFSDFKLHGEWFDEVIIPLIDKFFEER